MDPVSFDDTTSELSFVPEFFKGKPNRFISWLAGIRAGATLKKGAAIAEIQWDNGEDEIIKSPVAGTIKSTNRQIDHDRLHKSPAQRALTLS